MTPLKEIELWVMVDKSLLKIFTYFVAAVADFIDENDVDFVLTHGVADRSFSIDLELGCYEFRYSAFLANDGARERMDGLISVYIRRPENPCELVAGLQFNHPGATNILENGQPLALIAQAGAVLCALLRQAIASTLVAPTFYSSGKAAIPPYSLGQYEVGLNAQ